ncbi:MAG: hypothetical protein ACPGSI_16280 [Pikeienuella sp.]
MRHRGKLILGLIVSGVLAPVFSVAQMQEQKCRRIQITNPFDPYCIGYMEGLADGRTSVGSSAATPVGAGTVGTFIGTPDRGVLIGTSNRITVIQSLESLGIEPNPDLAKAFNEALASQGLDPSAFSLRLQREGALNASSVQE